MRSCSWPLRLPWSFYHGAAELGAWKAASFPVVFLPRCVTVLRKRKSYLVALLEGSLCPVFAGTLAAVVFGTEGPFFAGSEL